MLAQGGGGGALGIAGIDLCIMTTAENEIYVCKSAVPRKARDERQLEMLVETAEETAVPKTAASWRKPKNKSSAQKQKMP